jgi:HTH-type transcriptional regulator, sugar sensing transcriptional regulator
VLECFAQSFGFGQHSHAEYHLYSLCECMISLDILHKAGIPDKAAQVYVALLTRGPSSVRGVADACGMNRGSAYDYLKQLQELGLVLHMDGRGRQQFTAEHPRAIERLLGEKNTQITEAKTLLTRVLPELEALYHSGGEKPIARYLERRDFPALLVDVLDSCDAAGVTQYRLYSAEALQPYLYEEFPTFSDARIARGIAVRTIAFASGGHLRGLDERRVLASEQRTPTAIIVYPKKTAYISLSLAGEPVGVVIENDGISAMQTALFDALWQTLPQATV